jgi:hypothetical protein
MKPIPHQNRVPSAPCGVLEPQSRRENFSLLSANLLPEIGTWQACTHRQPRGTAIMVLPSPTSRLRRVYRAVARVLRAQGKRVIVFASVP